jgi:plasmid stabilization system protein ParE
LVGSFEEYARSSIIRTADAEPTAASSILFGSPLRPYRVYYRIDGEEVVIIHIRHTSQRPWRGEE